MTEMPTEAEAQAEISDIDALLKEAGKTMKRLQQRREALVPLSESTLRRLTVATHWATCPQWSHTGNDCNWASEHKKPWGDGPKAAWKPRTKTRLEGSGRTADALMSALRTITSETNREKADEDLAEIERLEREALEPRMEEMS